MKKKFKSVAVWFILLVVFSPLVQGAISLYQEGPYVPVATCAGPTPGHTEVKDIVALGPPPNGSWVMDTFSSRYGGNGWTFSSGNELSGELWVSHYVAFDRHVKDICYHGVEMSAYYMRGASDPWPLDWAQVFIASFDFGGCPAGTPAVDPVPSEDDGAPFYFDDTDNRWDYYYGKPPHAGTPPPRSDIIFGDIPYASHLEVLPFSVDVSFYLFLTSVDPYNPQHVFIHDSIFWGYEGECHIPEPATVCLLGAGFVALLRKRKQVFSGK